MVMGKKVLVSTDDQQAKVGTYYMANINHKQGNLRGHSMERKIKRFKTSDRQTMTKLNKNYATGHEMIQWMQEARKSHNARTFGFHMALGKPWHGGVKPLAFGFKFHPII